MECSKNKKHLTIKAQKKLVTICFLLPAFLVMCAVILYPLLYELNLSFRNVTLMNLKSNIYPFIGFDNYLSILKDSSFYSTLLRTLIWTFVNVGLTVCIGLFLAMLLNAKFPGKKIYRTLLILPWAVPSYISVLTWKGMFNSQYGAVNIILSKIFPWAHSIPWLTDPSYTFLACIFINVWVGIPFMMMISIGGLQSISNELYEAADVDGATRWQKTKNITLPLMKSVLTPSIVLSCVWTFNVVNTILIMTSGVQSEKSQILVTLMYKDAFEYYKYGHAAAFSVIIFLILLCFSSLFLKAQKLDD
ncbi:MULTISPECIES: carbohydrate ABC transporter permease [Clostridium]|uniref:carbohydrate ABC transporter permease n=1 Tax=Clostridium TaxID=1485 RepID=UPI00069D7B80|nr:MULTISPECIES: sugar ABC transporter permease [Clostridium]MCD2348778.1 sugar ABC transporter permease [Clostridium guangxiense]